MVQLTPGWFGWWDQHWAIIRQKQWATAWQISKLSAVQFIGQIRIYISCVSDSRKLLLLHRKYFMAEKYVLDGEIKYFYRCLILFEVLDKNSYLINTNDFFLQSLSALQRVGKEPWTSCQIQSLFLIPCALDTQGSMPGYCFSRPCQDNLIQFNVDIVQSDQSILINWLRVVSTRSSHWQVWLSKLILIGCCWHVYLQKICPDLIKIRLITSEVETLDKTLANTFGNNRVKPEEQYY